MWVQCHINNTPWYITIDKIKSIFLHNDLYFTIINKFSILYNKQLHDKSPKPKALLSAPNIVTFLVVNLVYLVGILDFLKSFSKCLKKLHENSNNVISLKINYGYFSNYSL